VRVLEVELYRGVLVYEFRLAQRARYALNYLAVLPELCPKILVLPTPADIFSASKVQSSVADTDPESCLFLTPGSGIRKRFFPDPGSWISNPYF
jgi:hypothetical protein